MYYLRTRPAAQAIQFTADQTALKAANKAAAPVAPIAPVPATGASQEYPTPKSTPGPSPPASTEKPAASARSTEPPPSPTRSHYASPEQKAAKIDEPEPLSLNGLHPSRITTAT